MSRRDEATCIESHRVEPGCCVVRKDGRVVFQGFIEEAPMDTAGMEILLHPDDFACLSEDLAAQVLN